jgi:membrane protease YdiL (CAAX protease family)
MADGATIADDDLAPRLPGLWHCLLIFLLLQICVFFVADLVSRALPFDKTQKMVFCLSWASLASLACYHRMAARHGWRSLEQLFPPIANPMALTALALPLAVVALFTILDQLLEWAGISLAEPPPELPVSGNWADMLWMGLATTIVVPAEEELLFRGVILGWLRRWLPDGWAILLSALAFAALHDNNLSYGLVGWLLFAERVGLGVVMATLALRTGSLTAGFLAHFSNNLLVVLARVLFPSS